MASNQSSNLVGSHESNQHDHSTTIQAAIGSLIFILLTSLQVMYQNDHNSSFKTHGLIMKIFIVFAFIYSSVAVAAIMLQIQDSHCTRFVPVLNHFGLVLGAFVCDFLLLILVRTFGYFVLALCTLMLLIVLLKSYQQIVKLIHDGPKLSFDGFRDLLNHVYEYYINVLIQQITFPIRIQFNLRRSSIIGRSEEGQVAMFYDPESNLEID